MLVMRKLIVAALLALAGTASAWAQSSTADSTSNVLSVRVLETNDLTRIPIQVSLTNELPITCAQCYIATPDTIDLFVHNEDDKKKIACTPSDRWGKQHHSVVSWAPKSDPHTAVAMVVSSANEDFKGNEGPIMTLYFDGSKLGNGVHSVKMLKGNVAWTDHKDIKVFYTPDAEVSFTIKRGKVVASKVDNKENK